MGAPMSAAAPMANRIADPAPRAAARLWLYRALAAVGLPVLLLLVLEGGLRVAGYGRAAGFLIPDDQSGYYRTNPEFVSLFMPESFDLRPLNFRVALRKPAGTVRIVLLGESAAQGVPAPPFALAPQLRAQFQNLALRFDEFGGDQARHVAMLQSGWIKFDPAVVMR